MKAIIGGAIVLCLALIGLGVYLATRESTDGSQTPSGPRILALHDSYLKREENAYWTYGSTNPKVVVTEYADFQCPACGSLYPALRQSLEITKDIAQLRFYQFPITSIHNKALTAAVAAEAAGQQGKFWEMHDLLFDRQKEWSEQTSFAFRETLLRYAKQLELDVDQFERDLNDSNLSRRIMDEVAKAGNSISGTPTVYINGLPLNPPPRETEALVKIILEAAHVSTP